MIFKKNKISLVVFAFISACLVFFNCISFPNNILSWDVFGYYMYLPMIFIYHNWGLQDVNTLHTLINQYHSSSTLYQAYQAETGFWVMRYSMGMAILYAPFFFIAHILCYFTSYPQDGFSLPYQTAILAGGIFYSALGFYFLRKVLLRYVADAVTAFCLAIIFFGTNYFMHTCFHGTNAMSHNYLFTLYALILWFTIKWHETFRIKYLIFLGMACGLNILARPSEAVCLFIPFFWETGTKYSFTEKLKIFLTMKKHIFLFFSILMVIAVPQLIYWKIMAGKFLFNSYGNNPGEGFEFLHPYISEVLFSFRKGWLIYTPVMIFAIAGIFFSLKQQKDFSYPVLIFFILNLFIVSSWSCWWYAESFGQRSMIPAYVLMALPLSMFLQHLFYKTKKWLRTSVLAIIGLFILLNIFQTWQFLNGIIHPSRMTKDAYFAVFGKTNIPEGMEKLLMIDRSAPGTVNIDEAEYSKTKEFSADLGKNENGFQLDSANIYSPNIEKTYSEITGKDHAKLKVSIKIFCTADIKNNPGSLVVSFEHKGYAYGYFAFDIDNKNIELKQWTEVSVNYLTPVIRTNTDKLKVYYWHRGKMPVFTDDLKVEVWEKRE